MIDFGSGVVVRAFFVASTDTNRKSCGRCDVKPLIKYGSNLSSTINPRLRLTNACFGFDCPRWL
ncbi:hypothetical protein C2E31_03330 [Rhodopirellula baltica]|nr:hypothetical protein C2E31_03330 [Rhodopirellula baltica]